MFFTRQHSTHGQQAPGARSLSLLARLSDTVKNWSSTSICSEAPGKRNGQCGLPGLGMAGPQTGSKPNGGVATQNHVSMKNAMNEAGFAVSDKLRNAGPLTPNTPDDPAVFENSVFFQKPSPRQPESPDVESLRSLLKANLSRETASPALMQRIRSRMHENKE